MEERLAQLFPDQVIQLKEYTSFVNQPERIQISSQQDMNDYDPNTLTTYYNFRVRLPRPALNVKTLQLARASIPNCIASFPDQECVWWYYTLPKVSPGNIYADNGGTPGALAYTFDADGIVYQGGVPVDGYKVYFDSGNLLLNDNNTYNFVVASNGNIAVEVYDSGNVLVYWIEYTAPAVGSIKSDYLRYVRLVPSNAQPELLSLDGFAGGYNRVFVDYDDLVTELNNATIDDPLNGENSNGFPGEFKFVPNQIAFSVDERFQKIIFTGLNTYFSYVPAASDDPIWAEAAQELAKRDEANTRFSFSGAIQIIQPFTPFRNLNLRLGFNYATYPQGENFLNMIRPIPPFIASPPLYGVYNTYDHVASGYADLVNTSCCHIYTDITGGATVDSIANKALLASIPLNTQSLGVGFHSLPLNNPLTKIATQLYEIYIELRTDAGEPLYLGNNAIVSLELILTY